MKDQNQTEIQLINELVELRKRIAELKTLENERKQTEEALQKSGERYRTLFEESRDAIYITTREGEIIDANQSMLDLFCYSKEEMIGLKARETYIHSEDRLKFQRMIEREGFVRDHETKLRKKDGTEMECLLTAIVRKTDDGNILGYQGIIRDITERKRMEEEREKLIRELQDALANIKTLHGLLPICSYCKKIRDDKGYWNRIESYIQDHSGAEFTHGMCPECLKKHYPDLVD
jgi:PAS domain S-box-containing protein